MTLLSEEMKKFYVFSSLEPKGVFPDVESALVEEVTTRWVWPRCKLISHKDLEQL